MGVMGAFVFAAQMINFTVSGTGSSGHLCGGLLLSALLGPFAGFITMIGVLIIQYLMFTDGGIMALGYNIWNIAFYGCFIGALLIWKPIMKKRSIQEENYNSINNWIYNNTSNWCIFCCYRNIKFRNY